MASAATDSALKPYLDQLGKLPDHEIAKKAGVSRALVIAYRKRHDIPAYEGYKFGQPGHPPGGRKSTEDEAPKEPQPFRGRRSALDPYRDLLGTVPDAEIAKLANVTAENVRTYRVRRNIPATWQKEGEETRPVEAAPVVRPAARPTPVVAPPVVAAPTPAPVVAPVVAPVAAPAPVVVAPAVAAPMGRTAFVLSVETDAGPRSYVVIANDIAEAAAAAVGRLAKAHPGAAIKGIQRVADLLP